MDEIIEKLNGLKNVLPILKSYGGVNQAGEETISNTLQEIIDLSEDLKIKNYG